MHNKTHNGPKNIRRNGGSGKGTEGLVLCRVQEDALHASRWTNLVLGDR